MILVFHRWRYGGEWCSSERKWGYEGNVFITHQDGQPFTFATGQQATLKADAERLNDHPTIITTLLDLYRLHPCVQDAEALSFVPNGVATFTKQLASLTKKPLIQLVSPPELLVMRFVLLGLKIRLGLER